MSTVQHVVQVVQSVLICGLCLSILDLGKRLRKLEARRERDTH